MGSLIEYPKTLNENLRFRADLFRACQDGKIAAEVREWSKRDILFDFNVNLWTYDPRVEGMKEIPFITYPFQDEFILGFNEDLERNEDVFIDKSRDMGATWMVLGVFLHRWRTKMGENFRVGSRKQEMVDVRGDMSTHFEKMRFILGRLPIWLLPVGFNFDKHATFMRLLNPEGGSSIVGEATNGDFARGAREKAILFDEFEAWEMAGEAWRSASDATRCKVALGTPKGAGNRFAELSRSDEIRKKYHLMWWKHPLKSVTTEEHFKKLEDGLIKDRVDGYTVKKGEGEAPSGCYVDQFGKIRSGWYDMETQKRDRDDIRQNLDCNYLTSGNPVFDLLKCDLRLRECTEGKVGVLNWVIAPRYNEVGSCVNVSELKAEFIPSFNGRVVVWEEPDLTWENGYCCAADVAEGLEQGDYSTASVLKRVGEKPKVVASIHGHWKTFEYADELAKLATYFGKCYLAIERTGLGLSVVDQIWKIYPKLYHKEVFTRGIPQRTDKIGWDTNSGTKPQIIGNLGKAISEELFDDPDEGFWKETLTFVNDDGKLEAQGKSKGEKCFDDRVMREAILLWIHNQLPLPARVKEKIVYTGWRKGWFETPRRREVGWVA